MTSASCVARVLNLLPIEAICHHVSTSLSLGLVCVFGAAAGRIRGLSRFARRDVRRDARRQPRAYRLYQSDESYPFRGKRSRAWKVGRTDIRERCAAGASLWTRSYQHRRQPVGRGRRFCRPLGEIRRRLRPVPGFGATFCQFDHRGRYDQPGGATPYCPFMAAGPLLPWFHSSRGKRWSQADRLSSHHACRRE